MLNEKINDLCLEIIKMTEFSNQLFEDNLFFKEKIETLKK